MMTGVYTVRHLFELLRELCVKIMPVYWHACAVVFILGLNNAFQRTAGKWRDWVTWLSLHSKSVAKRWPGCSLLGFWYMELVLFTEPISFFACLSGSSVLRTPYYTWVCGRNEITGRKERRKMEIWKQSVKSWTDEVILSVLLFKWSK